MNTIDSLLAKDDATRAALTATYRELCAARDEVNAKVAPVQERLDVAILKTAAARAEELALAAEIEALWGPRWLELKRRIAEIARSLGKIPKA